MVMSGDDAPPTVGNCLPLSKIPLGMTIHNIELQAGRGGALCRSAGTSATLMAREAGWAQISLPSGEIRRIPSACRATIGATSNPRSQVRSCGAKRVAGVGWAAVRTFAAPR